MGIVQKIVVEVVDARDLKAKDGNGSSSPYVVIDFHEQRSITKTVARDLNPVWNETFTFKVYEDAGIFGNDIELDVYHKKEDPNDPKSHLGRVRINWKKVMPEGEEELVYYKLKKKHLPCKTKGEIGLKIYYTVMVVED